MVGHAFYGGAPYRASLEPSTYRLLRRLGFRGVAITDSLSLVHDAPVERWAPQAIRAGADLLLFTSPAHARRAVRALLPLARRGALLKHVERVLRFRRQLERRRS
jgi:beta-glucosidase-like glycosyl hydrolase